MADAKKALQKASNFWERFADVQSKVSVRRDKSGVHGAKYRDLNAILDVVKPALAEHKLFLIFQEHFDGPKVISTAQVSDGSDIVVAYGHAAIDDTMKGSLGQKFGAATTYARRYAVEGLFAICETACFDDIDAAKKPEVKAKAKSKAKPEPKKKAKVVVDKDATPVRLKACKEACRKLANDCDIPFSDILEFIYEEYGVKDWTDIDSDKQLDSIYLGVKGYCDRGTADIRQQGELT